MMNMGNTGTDGRNFGVGVSSCLFLNFCPLPLTFFPFITHLQFLQSTSAVDDNFFQVAFSNHYNNMASAATALAGYKAKR